MRQDIRYALRALARNPGLTAGAIVACALGVGSATAVFSVVDRILFRPLPYRDGARLVSVGITAPLDSSEFLLTQNYLTLRRDAPPFSSVTAFQAGANTCDLTESGALRLRCLRVDADFLDVLGIAPKLGRTISNEENRPGHPPVALISHALWRSRYGSDPALPGKTMMLDGAPTRIVGVLPADFETPTLTEADILLALQPDEARERPGRFLRAFARMKAGIAVEQASTQLQPYFQGVLETVPARFRKEVKLRVQSVRDRQTASVKPASLALLGAVLAVLLIACANIANLLLARAAARDREMAVRAALGASRFRLARLAVTESLLLAVAGGALGVALAHGLLRLAISIAPGVLPRLADASLDARVLFFALAITGAAGLLTGLAPAWQTPSGILGSSRGVAPSVTGLRAALVAAQIAASMVLLTGAGLLLRSLWNLENVRLGLEPDRVVTARFTLGRARYQKPEDQVAFFNALERRLAAIPGLEAAAITDSLPPTGGMRSSPFSAIAVEGRPPLPEGTGGMVAWRYVTEGYFSTLGIPIVRGRGFTQEDRGPHVYSVILSDSLARRMFPNEDALGKHILRHEAIWFRVVGVAADVKNSGLGQETAPEYYRLRKPAADLTFFNAEPPTGWRAAAVLARTNLNPQAVAALLKDSVQSIDSTVPVETGTMRARLREVTAGSRFQSILLSAFGAIGILLAAVGSFGVTAFLVAQRRREMGIRLALGATTSHIQWVSIRRVAWWTGLGLALGLAGSYAAARSLRALLFGVEPQDPATLAIAALLLAVVTCVAAWLPARRAAQVDPAEVLTPE